MTLSATSPELEDLLLRAKSGEPSACDELARDHRQATYIFALQLVGNPDDAMDLAQEAMLRAWSRTFFDLTLLPANDSYRAVFSGDAVLTGVYNDPVYPSYDTADARTVDHYQDSPDDITRNTLNGAVANSGGFDVFDEFRFNQGGGDTYNGTFFHDTDGLVARWLKTNETFESEIPAAQSDNSAYRMLSVRIGQVNDSANSASTTMNVTFGLEDGSGLRVNVETVSVGRIPHPYAHPFGAKSMMRTLRIPFACFDRPPEATVDVSDIEAVHYGSDPTPQGALAIDQIQFSE